MDAGGPGLLLRLRDHEFLDLYLRRSGPRRDDLFSRRPVRRPPPRRGRARSHRGGTPSAGGDNRAGLFRPLDALLLGGSRGDLRRPAPPPGGGSRPAARAASGPGQPPGSGPAAGLRPSPWLHATIASILSLV